MAIVKVKKKANPFVQIDKEGIEDSNLSWGATGLLTYLIGRPDDWEANITHLSGVKKDKKTATTNAIHELRNAGYCHYFEIRVKGRVVSNSYLVFENVTTIEEAKDMIELQEGEVLYHKAVAPKKSKVLPKAENPTSVNATSEKPTLIIKEGNNKRINKKPLANRESDKNFKKREEIKEVLDKNSVGLKNEDFEIFKTKGHNWKIETLQEKIDLALDTMEITHIGSFLVKHGGESLEAFKVSLSEYPHKKQRKVIGEIKKIATPKTEIIDIVELSESDKLKAGVMSFKISMKKRVELSNLLSKTDNIEEIKKIISKYQKIS